VTRNVSFGSDSREVSEADDAVETARIALGSLVDLDACSFEPWPFDVLLPRIERGRIVLPADEIGVRSYADWKPDHGIELPLRIDGLQIGRFVLVPSDATTGVTLPCSARDAALVIADECATALTARSNEGVLLWKT
jgi:hypothetical protein